MQKRLLLVAVALAGARVDTAHAVGTWDFEAGPNKPVVTSTTETFDGATPPNQSADVSIFAPSQTTTWVFNRDFDQEIPPQRNIVATFTRTGGTGTAYAAQATVSGNMGGKGKVQVGVGFNDVRLGNMAVGSFNEGLKTATFDANAVGTPLAIYGQPVAGDAFDDRPRMNVTVSVSIGRQYSITPLQGRGTPEHRVTFPGVTITTSNIQLVAP